MTQALFQYCQDELKRHDRDRYLILQLARPEWREDLAALFAFNAEIARVRDMVTEPTLGAVRLEWWREAVKETASGRPPRHEVCDALALAMQRRRISSELLLKLIDARDADLTDEAPQRLEDLVSYAQATSEPLAIIASQMMGVLDSDMMDAAKCAFTAYALLGIARATPYWAAKGRVMLPYDLVEKHRLSLASLKAGKATKELAAVIADIAAAADPYIASVRARRYAVPRLMAPLLLHATFAARYRRHLARHNHDVFALAKEGVDHMRIVRLLWAYGTGRY